MESGAGSTNDTGSVQCPRLGRIGAGIGTGPAVTAPVLATLGNAIAALAAPLDIDAAWAGVRLPDGRSGHVARAQACSPVEYRAPFNGERGRWRLTALRAGD